MSSRWELYQASIPENADLVSSKDTPGWLRGFFRGQGGIEGHAEFAKVDLRRPAVIVVAVSLAAGVLGTLAVVRKARITPWWDDQAIPTVQAVRRRITRKHKTVVHDATTEMAMSSKTALEAFSRDLDVALEDSKSSMSSAEAQQHLLAILMAASIIADSMRALSDARIENDADLPELQSVMERLTTQQVTDAVNRMLATNTCILDGETSAILARIFGGGHVVGGEYAPLRRDRIQEALSLSTVKRPLPAS